MWHKLSECLEELSAIMAEAPSPVTAAQVLKLKDNFSVDVHSFDGKLYVGLVQKTNGEREMENKMNFSFERWSFLMTAMGEIDAEMKRSETPTLLCNSEKLSVQKTQKKHEEKED